MLVGRGVELCVCVGGTGVNVPVWVGVFETAGIVLTLIIVDVFVGEAVAVGGASVTRAVEVPTGDDVSVALRGVAAPEQPIRKIGITIRK